MERLSRNTAGAGLQGLEICAAKFFAGSKTLVGLAGRRAGDALYPVCDVARLFQAGPPEALCAKSRAARQRSIPRRRGLGVELRPGFKGSSFFIWGVAGCPRSKG